MNKEHFCLTYFITRPFFFGLIYSHLFNLTGNDSLICCLIGTLLGLIILFCINKMQYSSERFKVLQGLFYLFLIALSFSSIETYVSSYLLTKTPKIVVIIPAILLVSYVSFKDTISLKKSAFIFFILSISSFTIIHLLLGNYLNWHSILPFFTHQPSSLIKASLVFAIMSSFPNMLLKEEHMPLKKQSLYYLITSLINTIACFFILSVLTPNVAKIYSYPEYMALKRIKVLSFIENVENLSVLVWYFDYFILLVFIFKRLFELIKKKVVFFTIIILTTFLTTFYIADNFYLIMWLYNYSPLIMMLFFFLFLITIKSNGKRKLHESYNLHN